jgi:hypothetical protein
MTMHVDHGHGHTHRSLGATLEVAPSDSGVSVAIDVDDHYGALVVYGNEKQSGLEVHLRRRGYPERDIHVWMLPRVLSTGSQTIAAVFGSLEHDTYDILSGDGSISRSIEVPAGSIVTTEW